MEHLTSRKIMQAPKRWRKVNVWSIKGPILVVALLLGLCDRTLHWGRTSFAAGLAMVVPIIGFRDCWKERRFWLAIAALGVAQVPLVIELGPLMEQLKFPLMFAFGILDSVLVAVAISWICSEQG